MRIPNPTQPVTIQRSGESGFVKLHSRGKSLPVVVVTIDVGVGEVFATILVPFCSCWIDTVVTEWSTDTGADDPIHERLVDGMVVSGVVDVDDGTLVVPVVTVGGSAVVLTVKGVVVDTVEVLCGVEDITKRVVVIVVEVTVVKTGAIVVVVEPVVEVVEVVDVTVVVLVLIVDIVAVAAELVVVGTSVVVVGVVVGVIVVAIMIVAA